MNVEISKQGFNIALLPFSFNSNNFDLYASFHIQSECGKMWTRITPNADTFFAGKEFFKNTKNEQDPLKN